MKKPIDFLNRFGITEVSIVEKTEIEPFQYSHVYNRVYDYVKHDYEPLHVRQRTRPYIKCELPQNCFEELAGITEEWFELMRDPECAQLVMEARFINRLKRGK